MGKSILVPSKVFVTVSEAVTRDARLKEIIDRALEQKMVVLGFYFKDGDVLAVVTKARHDDRVFEVRLVDTQLNTIEWFNTNSDKMFLSEIDVLKDAKIAGSVLAYWIMEKMRAAKERIKLTILAYFYDTEDEELYVLIADEYFVKLRNITGILWDP